jgi:hypothetical protein
MLYVDDVKYFNLFPLSIAKELVEDFIGRLRLKTPADLAKRLLEYKENDT